MKKTALTMALATALGLAASVANAASVTSMTLADTINANGTAITTDDTLGTDTRSGAFRFNNINLGTYAGSSFFSGNVNGGAINVAAANTAGSFSTGFDYLGQMFIPFTAGPINADITGGVLTVTSLPWGGNYGGATNFFLAPDAGTLVVNNLVALNATALSADTS